MLEEAKATRARIAREQHRQRMINASTKERTARIIRKMIRKTRRATRTSQDTSIGTLDNNDIGVTKDNKLLKQQKQEDDANHDLQVLVNLVETTTAAQFNAYHSDNGQFDAYNSHKHRKSITTTSRRRELRTRRDATKSPRIPPST